MPKMLFVNVKINKGDLMPEPNSEIRQEAIDVSKSFKRCWIKTGIILSSIVEGESYNNWGFKSFEEYTNTELGIKKSLALNIVKNYNFLLDWEPELLEPDFLEKCSPEEYPDMEKISVLRRVKSDKHLSKEDYDNFRKDVLVKHRPIAEVRKDLTSLIKERKEESSDEVRDKKHSKSVKRFVANAKVFTTEANSLKILPADLLKRVNDVIADVEGYLDA